MESMIQSQEIVAHEPVMLNKHDVDWLATFNILPDTPNQTHSINTLNKLNQRGSIDLRSFRSEADIERRVAIVQARYDFFALMGLSDTMAKAARHKPTLLQPELFIILQRELYMLGLDGPGITQKLPYGVLGRDSTIVRRKFEVLQELGLKPVQTINRFPSILGHSEEAIQSRIRYLEELGLKPIQIINRFPGILGYSEETIRAKIRCLEELDLKPIQVIHRFPNILGLSEKMIQSRIRYLEELGLKPIQIINRFPSICRYSEETIRAKIRCLEELDLKPIQVIHRFPNILGLSEKMIQSKVRCLEELGLKSAQVINRCPSICGYSEETIRAKVRCLEELDLKPIQIINSHPAILGVSEKMLRSKVVFLQRTVKLLKWEYTAEMLLNIQPTLLGYNFEKLQILRRLLAHNVVPASRYCPPSQTKNASIVPLEAYIIVLADMNKGEQLSLEKLYRQASRVQQSLAQASRRATAKTITESANKTLGSRVCRMYSEYAKP